MSLISVFDFEILPEVKIQRNMYTTTAIKKLRKERKFQYDGYEEVIDFGEFILMLNKMFNDGDNRRGNVNAKKK